LWTKTDDYTKLHNGTFVWLKKAIPHFACVYPLAFACLKADPASNMEGLFFIAPAASLGKLRHIQQEVCEICLDGVCEVPWF
jgi:hypothetical protein